MSPRDVLVALVLGGSAQFGPYAVTRRSLFGYELAGATLDIEEAVELLARCLAPPAPADHIRTIQRDGWTIEIWFAGPEADRHGQHLRRHHAGVHQQKTRASGFCEDRRDKITFKYVDRSAVSADRRAA